MADLSEDRIESCLKALKERFQDDLHVIAERKFIGFDTYRKAIKLLRPQTDGQLYMAQT